MESPLWDGLEDVLESSAVSSNSGALWHWMCNVVVS